MNLFTRQPKTQVSPWGNAEVQGKIATVSLGRFRGVCIDLWWTLGEEPTHEQVEEVRAHLLSRWDAALEFLGVAEFPRSLRVIVPESIHFPAGKDEWEMTFVYTKWEDGYWTVVFRGAQPISHHEGD
ncbi:hypothetical protein [Opitutus terrae]|uniref:Uncharacterized protein n=1 Tax=Opitutus terrae (strain DSM 11246 / JCM 15787 / PB90-1) TaxID=452637 RepID=B1ZTZ2_OPITP|nr:hypothetical protein [Opitutus terrae]ACB75874.1 hypothetical protein Oter_2592 [Opitutus terrae PB90-1]